MPYVDPNGEIGGWSEVPQPDLGYTEWVDEPPYYSDPLGLNQPAPKPEE
jgi:hypothetical protein